MQNVIARADQQTDGRFVNRVILDRVVRALRDHATPLGKANIGEIAVYDGVVLDNVVVTFNANSGQKNNFSKPSAAV